jgi:signal transduction histidine kinase
LPPLPEELLRPFAEHLPDAVAVYDLDGRCVYANPASERLFQQPAASLLGKVLWEQLPGLTELPFHQSFLRIASGELAHVSLEDSSEAPLLRAENTLMRLGHRIVAICREPTTPPHGKSEPQAAMRQLRLLSDASMVLSASWDRGELLQRLAGLMTSSLADWCLVDGDSGGRLTRLAVASARRSPLVDALRGGSGADAPGSLVRLVLERGEPILVAPGAEAPLAPAGTAPDLQQLRALLGECSLMVLPLCEGVRTIGALTLVASGAGRSFSAADLDLASQLVLRAEVALDTLRLYAELRERQARLDEALSRADATAARAAQLQRLTAALSAAVSREDVVHVAVEDARTMAGAGAAFFGLVDKEQGTVVLQGAVGLTEELARVFGSVPLHADTVLARIVREGRPFLVQLSAIRQAFPHVAPFWERAGYQSGVGVPLTIAGERIGAFGMLFREERVFSEEEQHFLLTLGELCGQALQRTRLYAEARAAEARSRRNAERLSLLSDVSRALSEATFDHDSVLRTVARISSEAVGDSCLLTLLSEDGRFLDFAAMDARDESIRAFQRELQAVADQSRMSASDGLSGQVLRTGRPLRRNDLGKEYDAVRKPELSARLRTLPVHAALLVPVRGSNGVLGVLSVARYVPDRPYTSEDEAFLQEIADRTAVAVEKTRLYREARDAVSVRDDFLSVAGHELKTPITAALLQVQLIERQVQREPQLGWLSGRLATLRRQVARLQSLVDRLLDVSRVTAGRLVLEREEFDLGELAREVIERAADDASRAGSPVTLHVAEPVRGSWDRLRIDSVLTNLVSNAVKYGAGSPIEVWVGRDGGQVQVGVRDRGIGIAPEQQARIFGKFERAVSIRHYGGFGLGLWITRQIIESHGGSIELTSAPGAGSTFLVKLPQREPSEEA